MFRSLSDLRLFYCGIEETGQFSRSISLNRPNYSPRSSEKSASVPQSLATNAQAGQAPRRASAGISRPISSSRNNADGCFWSRPKGAPQTRPGGVTALGNSVSYSLRSVPSLGAFGGALRVKNKAKWGTINPEWFGTVWGTGRVGLRCVQRCLYPSGSGHAPKPNLLHPKRSPRGRVARGIMWV